MTKIALPLAACLLAVAAVGVSAQSSIWKWRDASGQIHLSDTAPPPGTPEKNILQRGNGTRPAADDAPAVAASGTDSDLQKKKQKADQDKALAAADAKARAEQKNADARAQNCRSAQDNARTLQSGQRISHVNAQGEKEFLDDAAIAAQTKRAQDIIASNCGAASPAP